jgi:hypothetical protein
MKASLACCAAMTGVSTSARHLARKGSAILLGFSASWGQLRIMWSPPGVEAPNLYESAAVVKVNYLLKDK